MKKVLFSVIILLALVFTAYGQAEDPVLFTVDDNPVHVSEFLYIYQKNNGNKADYSEKSLNEYLDLYTKFKLKVNKARKMQLDTIPELINELAGYRKQLSKSYLVDKEVNQKLVKEVFDRRKKDLNVSHILILTKDDADMDTDVEAKAKIFFIYDQLQKGVSFAKLARENSEDKSTARTGGNLGFLTSMLPDGFYAFENAIYDLEPGQFSAPFKTDYGYHIARVNNQRPARGKIEAAHIMIKRKTGQSPNEIKQLIDSIHNQLDAGANFEELAREFSMDKKTKMKGGYIGIFGINKYESIFEDKAFALKQDGEYTKPFESSAGWHIVKRISKPDQNDFDRSKRSIASEVSKDSRFNVAKKVLIEKIKEEAGFKENPDALESFISQIDPSFYSLYWKIPESVDAELFSLGENAYLQEDFAIYCKNNQRERVRYGRNTDLSVVVRKMYDKFVGETSMQYEEDKLEERYPDFRSLMREYDEGILLFEATKREVWDKASQDTSGLNAFYEENKKNYLWRPRADLYTYTVHSGDEQLAKKAYKFTERRSHEKVIGKFNKDNQIISFTRNKVENGSKELVGMNWEENAVSTLHFDKENGTYTFKKIAKLIPETPKSLDDARGYVIADYQEYLEKNWVKTLKEEFEVKVDEKVFNSLIKK